MEFLNIISFKFILVEIWIFKDQLLVDLRYGSMSQTELKNDLQEHNNCPHLCPIIVLMGANLA